MKSKFFSIMAIAAISLAFLAQLGSAAQSHSWSEIDTSGSIGIGISSALAKLHVRGNFLVDTTSGIIGLFQDSFGKIGIGTTAPQAKLHISGGDALFDGNVGIGKAPTQKLDVAGQIKSSSLDVSGQIKSSSVCIGSDCKTAWPEVKAAVSDSAGTWRYLPGPAGIFMGNNIQSSSGKVSLTAVSGKLYVVGLDGSMQYGQIHQDSCKYVYEFDPQTKKWGKKAQLPVPLTNAMVSEYNGELYVFGGMVCQLDSRYGITGYTPEYSKAVYKYNPQSNSWSKVNDLPEEQNQNGGTAVTIGNKIYVFRYGNVGRYYVVTPTKIFVYSPSSNNWVDTKTVTPPEGANAGSGSAQGIYYGVPVLKGNELHFFGVQSGSGWRDGLHHWKYDINADRWHFVDFSAPAGGSQCVGANVNGEMYIICQGTPIFKYNTDSSSGLGYMVEYLHKGNANVAGIDFTMRPTSDSKAAVIDNKIYISSEMTRYTISGRSDDTTDLFVVYNCCQIA